MSKMLQELQFSIKSIILLMILVSCKPSNINNQEGYKICLKNLEVIKSYVQGSKPVSIDKLSSSIIFFEEVTGIKSKSGGNYLGQFTPTKEDYNLWKDWIEKNKAKLYWDNIEKKVKVGR